MTVRLLKVSPIPDPSEDHKHHKTKRICLCKTLMPVMSLARLVGLFPIIVKHQSGKCLFQKSPLWSLYSFMNVGYFAYEVAANVDYLNLVNHKSLLPMLDDITSTIFMYYVILATLLVLMKAPKMTETLNRFSTMFKDGLFCSSARRIALLTQYGIIFVVSFAMLLQGGVYIWLWVSESYRMLFGIRQLLLRMSQSITFVIYAQIATIVAIIIGSLACFEQLTMNCLGYVPIHPMKGVDETHNSRDFLGLFTFKLCKNDHPTPNEVSSLSAAEVVEYLRIRHEEISLCIYSYNDSMNPLLLVHTVVELTLLIVHWYAVIAFFVYSFDSPVSSTIHVFNCLFVLLHTWGLYLFMKNAQSMKNMIDGLIFFLLEYSTRISNEDDHLQVRFFIEKLKQHRPFTASGVFNIDLGIAGPISANILTYVLVALQFELPDD